MAARQAEFEEISAPYGCLKVIILTEVPRMAWAWKNCALCWESRRSNGADPWPTMNLPIFYDELNSEADYDALYRYVPTNWRLTVSATASHADLGCGTGDLT